MISPACPTAAVAWRWGICVGRFFSPIFLMPEAMARVIDEEIHSSADLDLLIHHLPHELEQAKDKDLGNPTVMSPEVVQAWIQQRKTQAAKQV